jgi:hypothetical protein
MDTDLFKLMLEKQKEWRDQYYADNKAKKIIRTITNRKYKSKGNKSIDEINESLKGVLDEVIITQRETGELCYDSLYGR